MPKIGCPHALPEYQYQPGAKAQSWKWGEIREERSNLNDCLLFQSSQNAIHDYPPEHTLGQLNTGSMKKLLLLHKEQADGQLTLFRNDLGSPLGQIL